MTEFMASVATKASRNRSELQERGMQAQSRMFLVYQNSSQWTRWKYWVKDPKKKWMPTKLCSNSVLLGKMTKQYHMIGKKTVKTTIYSTYKSHFNIVWWFATTWFDFSFPKKMEKVAGRFLVCTIYALNLHQRLSGKVLCHTFIFQILNGNTYWRLKENT